MEKLALERMKLELEKYELNLICDGKISAAPVAEYGPTSLGSSMQFDVAGHLCLVPKFSEKEPDTFFSLFERVADHRNWPDSEHTWLLQCVLTAKDQKAYSSLMVSES